MKEGPTVERRWVVGVDGSDGANVAVDWAAQHADGRAGSLWFVSCWRPPTFGPYPAVDEPASSPYDDSALERHALSVAQRVADRVQPHLSIDVEPIARRGRSAPSLLEASAGAALLVVGRRGRGGFPGLRLGSTSSQCATHSNVPVVVVPAGASKANRIVVGDDGSPNSAAAVRWALDFAGAAADVEVVTAVEGDAEPQPVDGRSDVACRVEHGRPRDVLGAAARDADLIVVGSRGRGMITAAVLGSVSSWLLHDAEIPVVVVPDRPS